MFALRSLTPSLCCLAQLLVVACSDDTSSPGLVETGDSEEVGTDSAASRDVGGDARPAEDTLLGTPDVGLVDVRDGGRPDTRVDVGGEPDSGAPDLPPSCPGSGQQKSTYFSRRPADDGTDRIHENLLIDLLDCAPAGSQVRVTIFHVTRNSVADAFVRAQDRGVDVALIVDWDNRDAAGTLNGALQTVQASLGGDFIVCGNASSGACIGSNINHNKFATFSELVDGSTNVVYQSSSNMTASQRRKHNATVLIRDDAALHDAYRGYWDDLRAQQRDPGYYQRLDGDTNTRIYLSPRATGDTVVNVLDNMECASGGELRVAMSLFTSGRTAVADQLVDMQNEGCTISMVLRGDAEAPPAVILQTLDAAGVPYVQYRERASGWNVHSKYWIWEGRYAGSAAPRRIVFTGSHNWTGNALRNNDEVMMRIEDDSVYAAFLDDFAQLLNEAP